MIYNILRNINVVQSGSLREWTVGKVGQELIDSDMKMGPPLLGNVLFLKIWTCSFQTRKNRKDKNSKISHVKDSKLHLYIDS